MVNKMIGFNNKGFAGKTQEEKAELAEAERLDRLREKYEDDFSFWVSNLGENIEKTAKLTARTANKVNNFAYLNANWFNYIVLTFAILCFMFGWCSHDIYIHATDKSITKAIGALLHRFIFGVYAPYHY